MQVADGVAAIRSKNKLFPGESARWAVRFVQTIIIRVSKRVYLLVLSTFHDRPHVCFYTLTVLQIMAVDRISYLPLLAYLYPCFKWHVVLTIRKPLYVLPYV